MLGEFKHQPAPSLWHIQHRFNILGMSLTSRMTLVRLMVKDKATCRATCEKMLQWDLQGLIVAHNCIIEQGAHAALADALAELM